MWELPRLTEKNRRYLHQQLLQHAVMEEFVEIDTCWAQKPNNMTHYLQPTILTIFHTQLFNLLCEMYVFCYDCCRFWEEHLLR